MNISPSEVFVFRSGVIYTNGEELVNICSFFLFFFCRVNNAWAYLGENKDNGRHVLHDVNAPPTASLVGIEFNTN